MTVQTVNICYNKKNNKKSQERDHHEAPQIEHRPHHENNEEFSFATDYLLVEQSVHAPNAVIITFFTLCFVW